MAKWSNFLSVLRIINSLPVIISTVEAVTRGTAKGSDKKKEVEARIMEAFQTSEFVTGRDIIDEKKFKRGLSKATDGIVQMLNASVWR